MRLPVRVRLTAAYTAFLVATLAALSVFLVLALRSDLNSRIDREARISLAAIEQSYATEGVSGFRETAAVTLRRSGAVTQVLDTRGRVIASYGGDIAVDPMVPARRIRQALAGGTLLFDSKLGDTGVSFRINAIATAVHGAPRVVAVGESLQGVDEAVRRVLVLLLIAVPVVMAAGAFGAWWLVRNALRPVDRMRRKAEQIGIERLHERLSAPHPRDEIGQLAATLNRMLERIESGVRARRQLVADASHELRTPLAAMRAELDVSLMDRSRTPAERAVLESVREDVDRMTRTVSGLLLLARADEGKLELIEGVVELEREVEGAARPLRAMAEAKGVRLEVDGQPSRTDGDPQRIQQAITNLIENAIEFTPPGGQVTVNTWQRGNEVGVTVADTGAGIPAEAQPHVFDRFYRADPSRSRESGGSGLGLAICREIVTAHGGRVWVQSEEGKGSAFSLALPADGQP